MIRHTLIALTTVFVLGVIGTLLGCNSASQGAAAPVARPGDAPTLSRTVVLDGLSGPWDMAFTPDGVMLFTEKCRGLSVRRADGSLQYLFGRDGAAVAATDFFCEGQSGAHGVAVDPLSRATASSTCSCLPPSRARGPTASFAWSWTSAIRGSASAPIS